MCEHLIVGVSTDELVRTYKHKETVIPYEERSAIVEAIRYVDRVVPQVSMDKEAAWEALRFDVMFVGDDWKGTDKWNRIERTMNSRGVDMVYLPYTQGTSSTIVNQVLVQLNQPHDSRVAH